MSWEGVDTVEGDENFGFMVNVLQGVFPGSDVRREVSILSTPLEMQEICHLEQLQEFANAVHLKLELKLLRKEKLYAKTIRAMSMIIRSRVKEKDIGYSIETSSNQMLRDLDQQMEKREDDGCTLWIKLYSKYEYEILYHLGKANVVIEALSRKERVKPRRMTYGKEGDESLYLRIVYDSVVGNDKDGVMEEAHAQLRKPLEFEVGDRVMLKVSPWKGVIRFGKKTGDIKVRFLARSDVPLRLQVFDEFPRYDEVQQLDVFFSLERYAAMTYPFGHAKIVILNLWLNSRDECLRGNTCDNPTGAGPNFLVCKQIRIGTVLKFDFLRSTCACKWLLGIMRYADDEVKVLVGLDEDPFDFYTIEVVVPAKPVAHVNADPFAS
ncbi:hypothetical protein Tco_0524476 [Tanacetum coccineum]